MSSPARARCSRLVSFITAHGDRRRRAWRRAPRRHDDRVCTVVVRWSPDRPTRILALRDELTGRDFDDPAPWWPDFPDVYGGRDRAAGGTWCATRVTTG